MIRLGSWSALIAKVLAAISIDLGTIDDPVVADANGRRSDFVGFERAAIGCSVQRLLGDAKLVGCLTKREIAVRLFR